MATGKTVDEALSISETDIYEHLEVVPQLKVHCISLARRTFTRALEGYQDNS